MYRIACTACAPPPSRAASPGGDTRRWRRWRPRAPPGRLPILCGGTGLYFSALVDGLSDIPDPGEAARREARALLAGEGPAALHARLLQADPETASRLRPSDGQRLARAWEVFAGTGLGLVRWQSQRLPAASWRFSAILLDPPRAELRAAIATRLDAMLHEGALDEVRALLGQGLDPTLPAMRAHGVAELAAHLRGEITLDQGRRLIERATGQYTRRQATWFRHRRMADPARTHTIYSRIAGRAQFSQSEWVDLQHFVRRDG